MHYLDHVAEAIRQIGPLKMISSRPLKRTIGNFKAKIKSRKAPAANAYTCVKDHFVLNVESTKLVAIPNKHIEYKKFQILMYR